VINAETACRIQEAVDEKKPLIDKDVTVGGKLQGNQQDKLIQVFLDVPLGTPVETMFQQAGGVAEGYGELIMGGPFTGKRTTMQSPVVKTTGGLIAAECFLKGPEKIGLLVCACGGNKARLEEIAQSMGSQVAGVEYCKQAHEVKGSLKCENPGRCPGQVQKVMALKKAGAQAVLISNCTDCSNTVMSCAPQLKLPVYHCTDGALRAVNEKLIRKIK
jgi:proline reductase-associated electron transfer protein PrdC